MSDSKHHPFDSVAPKRPISDSDDDKQHKYEKNSSQGNYRTNGSFQSSRNKQNPSKPSMQVPFWKKISGSKHLNELQIKSLGSFSILTNDDGKQIFYDDRYLRTYKYPLEDQNVNLNLRAAEMNSFTGISDHTIEPLLTWLSDHRDDLFQNDRFKFDTFSWRGVLRLIMFTCFEKQADWMLAVIKFKNSYFICEYSTELQVEKNNNLSAQDRLLCSYGHIFEDLVTESIHADETYQSGKQTAGVFLSTLGHHRMFYSGEMDCVDDQKSSQPENLELKLTAGKSLNDLTLQYNRKFAKWWLQSYLAGVRKIIVGFRDDNAIVTRLCPLELELIEQTTTTWTRQTFFNFFDQFMWFLKDQVVDEYSLENKSVVLFRYLPEKSEITAECSSDPKYNFIPDWFYNRFC